MTAPNLSRFNSTERAVKQMNIVIINFSTIIRSGIIVVTTVEIVAIVVVIVVEIVQNSINSLHTSCCDLCRGRMNILSQPVFALNLGVE